LWRFLRAVSLCWGPRRQRNQPVHLLTWKELLFAMYDALIIGGGPAGLSAAIYLARFRREVLVLDDGHARSSFDQVNDNYLGFPEGIRTQQLRELGRQQAERFGARFQQCRVERVEPTGTTFRLCTTAGDYEGRTLLFATGVKDVWPDVPQIMHWIGRQVFWCITCDGYRAVGKQVVCVGNTDEAAVTTLQLRRFTERITLVTDPALARFSSSKREDLARYGIGVTYDRPARLELSPEADRIQALCLEDGTVLSCDMIFSLLGIRPNTQLAREIGVELDNQGYIVMDEEGYTSIPGVFAAGDMTGMYTQQVASAVHAGAEAAQTMNYFLYPDYQKNPEDVSPQEPRGADPENEG
jgi:thioredoxin reductase (NADPH)